MIDEKKLIEEINKCDFTADVNIMKANDNGPQLKGFYIGYTEMMVKLQPKIDWIPCEERLPRRNEDVLVYRPKMAMPFLVDRYEGYYGEDDNEWYEGWAYSTNCEVIAWQPLPTPYKKEG